MIKKEIIIKHNCMGYGTHCLLCEKIKIILKKDYPEDKIYLIFNEKRLKND